MRHIDGRAPVWRNPGTRFDEANMIQHDRYGGGSVMVWGAISWCHKSELVIVDNTMDSNFYRDSI